MKKILLTFTLLSIFIFNSFSQNYLELTKQSADVRHVGAWFGYDVAIDGDWAVVGALYEEYDENEMNSFANAGAAYIYNFNGSNWVEMQKIDASDRSIFGQFGISVDISGNYIVIGANSASNTGAVYIFENIAGVWSEMQKITASDAANNDNFGISVAIDGTNIIVGAYQEDENVSGGAMLSNAGSAYVFSLSAGTWTQVSKIVASDRSAGDEFGYSVDISGNYVIVGAHLEDENAVGVGTLANAGSAYIFNLNTGAWIQQAKLVAFDRSLDSKYGFSVSIDGTRAIVGSIQEDYNAVGGAYNSNAGAVYSYFRTGTSWNHGQKLVASDRTNLARFGFSVDLKGNKMIVGSDRDRYDENAQNPLGTLAGPGSAYIFYEGVGNIWTQVQKIDATDRDAVDAFGTSVAISDSNIIVGSPFEDDGETYNPFIDASGSAYFYRPPPLPIQNIAGVINDYAAVVNIEDCIQEMTLDDATEFEVGDTIMIIQMKGATMNLTNSAAFGDLVSLNNAGNYEYNIIASKIGNVLSFQNAWQHPYAVAGKVQIVSIPSYSGDVNINGTLTADPWNGNKGGILIFNASGEVTLNADIDVSGLGFRGGFNDASIPQIGWSYFHNNFAWAQKYFYPLSADTAAQKGESIVAYTSGFECGKGKNLNGGGGGNKAEAGGGGGASRANGGNGGISDHPGGAYQFADRGLHPGIGGLAVIDGTRLFLGGAGGAGDGNNGDYEGGNGGGIVIINIGGIEGNSNSILANGQDGNNGVPGNSDGGSGGGAGGYIYINSTITTTTTNLNILSNGGNGGDTNEAMDDYCHGPGGGGGAGEIRTSISTNLTTSVIGGDAGIVTNSTIACNGSTKGATDGGNGVFINSNGPGLSFVNTPFTALTSIVMNTPPDTIEVCENGNTMIAIDTTGSNTTTNFQWQVLVGATWTDLANGGVYSGVNTDELNFTAVSTTIDNNFYRVLVYHPCDSVYSDSTNLQVNQEASISSQPQDTTVCIGNDGAFVALVSNVVSYQWQNNASGSFTNLVNNATYLGVSSDSLFINNVTASLNGVDFRLMIIDDCGLTSYTNLVQVNPVTLITIDALSSNLAFCAGEDSLLFVTTSFEADSYQWQVNTGSGFNNIMASANHSGITNDTLNLINVPFSFNNNNYRVVVMDACGTALTSTNINLTVNPNSSSTINDTICTNEMYTLPNGSMVNTANTYIDTVQNANGCDSIITTILVVNPLSSTTVNDTICSNEMYTLPDGSMVNMTNIYLDTIPSSNGCDSVITTNLVVNPVSSTSISDTICANEMYTLPDGSMVNIANTYIDTVANSNGCDSIITTNLVVNATSSSTVNDTICNNEMYTLPDGSIVNTADTYIDTISNSNGCDSIITTNLVVNPVSLSTVNDTICSNEMYTLPDGSMVNTANTYLDTLVNSNGCDSVITTNLIVSPASSSIINDTICSNEMYTLPDGSMVNTANTYLDTLVNSNGCDSVITTNLVVNPASLSTVNDTICSNEMYTLPDGSMVNITNTYIDTLPTASGCDSIVTINLVVNPTSDTIINDTICANEMYTLPDGSMVNTENTYIDTVQNTNGCDSIITTNLVVNATSSSTVNDTICSNEMYTLPDGSMVNTANTYLDTLVNSNGCDSVITTNLVVNATSSSTVNDTICNNEMYTLPDGSIVNTANTYLDTLVNSNGCDSVITTNLVVNPVSSSTVNDTICSNEMYTLPDGSMVNTTNTYIDTISNLNGCDSVITTNLIVSPASSSTINDTICSNEMYTLPDGSMVNMTNTYMDTIPTASGCDSIVTINLVVNPISETIINDTICANEMYTLPDGNMVNIANTYIDTISISNGCDSIITTNLVVNATSSSTVNDTICNNEMYTLPDGSIVNTADTYIDTISNSNGCDSIITTNLVVNPVSLSTVNDTICSNEMYTLPDGSMVNTANTYLDTLVNSNGCDSVITTNLVVNATSSSTVNDTICSNEMYTLPDGSMVNTANTYLDTLVNSNGCDSVITTNLVVNATSSSTVNDTICNNEMYTLPDGSIVNTANTYLDTLVNSNGCDSIITTNLVVNPVSSSTVNDTICSNEMYTLPDGSMVNTTNTYIDTISNLNGCDSVITTNLIVSPASSSTINDTICSNEMYTLPDGSMVNTTNTYIDTIPSLSACDSIITINLVVNPVSNTTINDTICNNEMYTLPDGSIVNTTDTYIDTLPTANSCDSIVTINLVVNPVSNTTINDTICSNEMYTLPDGSMVNTANTYLDTLVNSNGCDSVITTNLIVNATSSSIVNDTICANEMYTLPDGSMVNTADTYIDTIQNSNSCDSVITINLVVEPNINIIIQPADLVICEDSSAMFFIVATGTNIQYQWQINNGMGFINIPGETNDTLNIANVSIPLDLNNFEFKVVLNSFCGNTISSDSAILNITYNASLISNPQDVTICEDSDTSFTVTSNGNETSIQWQVDNGAGYINVINGVNYSGANTLTLNLTNIPLSFDGNNYRVIISDNCGFVDTSLFNILTVNPLAVIIAQQADINTCSGSDATFYVTASNVTNYQWQINTGAGFMDIVGETNDSLVLTNVNASMNGNIYICQVSNICTNLSSIANTLTVSEEADVISEPTDVIICPEGPGFNFQLYFEALNISTYQWQINTGSGFVNLTDIDNFQGSNTETLTVTVPFDNVDGATFRLQYTDDCGIGAVSNEYSVNVNEPLPVDGIEDVTYCQREIGIIEVDYDGTNYVWNDGNQTSGRFLVPEESGEYIVTFMQNSTSCMAMDTISVTLEDCLDNCVVSAPTGFSPNNTGLNDVFKAIYTCELDFFELMIVNRWGENVFFSNNPNNGWDGSYKNKPAPLDTYVWYIKYNKKGESKRQDISGNVTLLR